MFNSWVFLIPLYAGVMFVLGTTKYRKVRNRIVMVRKGDGTLDAVSGMLSLAVQISVISDSLHGLVQFILDRIAETDVGWLPILLAGSLIVSFLAFSVLFYYCGRAGEAAIFFFICQADKLKKKEEESFASPLKAH